MKQRLPASLCVALALLLGACASAPAPAPSMAAMELPPGAAVPGIANDWWRSFGDAQLDALVDEALRNNRDLARALARIDESRAALRLARAGQAPQVSAAVSAGRERVSGNAPGANTAAPVNNDLHLGLNLSYEVDLWARLARASDAAREDLLASELGRDTLRNALTAQVVDSYASLRSLDAQRQTLGEALARLREALALRQLRFDAGEDSALELRRAQAELAAGEVLPARLDRQRAEALRALALVLGRSARALVEQDIARAGPGTAPPRATDIPAGLPSDLLLRRPDLSALEARLRAAGARVEVARAAYLPAIALTGALGHRSSDFGSLLDGRSLFWSVLASLTQPIWGAGRLEAQSDTARARQLQAEIDYRDAMAQAFREASDALGASAEAGASLQSTQRQVDALQAAAHLTRLRYQSGEASRLALLESERAALLAQVQLVQSHYALTSAQVALFRALGGGWTASPDAASKP